MNRKLILLNGISILAVVLNHVAGWGQIALFWWAHRYRPVESPNYDQLGSVAYWATIIMKQLTVFSVPAFLFVAGAFMAYSGGTNGKSLSWKVLRARLKWLLIPYLIWSVIYFIWNLIVSDPLQPSEYLVRLLLGKANGAFFYVIILVQMLILSFYLVRMTVKYPRMVLLISGFIQLILLALQYSNYFPWMTWIKGFMPPHWFFGNWIFFFVAGIIFAQYQTIVRASIFKYRWLFFGLLLLAGILAVIEPERIAQLTGSAGWLGSALTFSTTFFSLTFILAFFAFDQVEGLLSQFFSMLGAKSYGIFLSHGLVLEVTAKVIYHAFPLLLGHLIFFLPLLLLVGLGVPYFMKDIIIKTPIRAAARYLFG